MIRTICAMMLAILGVTGLCLAQDKPADATTKPALADLCKDAVDPYDAGAERMRFFKATGKENELTEEAFAADAKRGGGFVRPFDSWKAMLAFDKNGNGKIDWFEAEAYREAARKKVLEMFDKSKAGKLAGDDRDAANKFLASGKSILDEKPAVAALDPNLAGPAATKPTAPPQGVYASVADLARMLDDCKLTPEQQGKLKKEIAALQEELKAGSKKSNDLDKACFAAIKEKDDEKLAALRKDLRQSLDDFHKIYPAHREKIMAVLTDEQTRMWYSAGMEREMLLMFEKAELTDEQKDKVKAMCEESAVQMAKQKVDDNRGTLQARRALYAKIEALLTDKQKEAQGEPPSGFRPKPAN